MLRLPVSLIVRVGDVLAVLCALAPPDACRNPRVGMGTEKGIASDPSSAVKWVLEHSIRPCSNLRMDL